MNVRKLNQLEFKRLCLYRQDYHYLLFDSPFKSTIAINDTNINAVVDDDIRVVCLFSFGDKTTFDNCIEVFSILNVKAYEVIKIKDIASLAVLSLLSIKCQHNNEIEFCYKNALLTILKIKLNDTIEDIINNSKIAVDNILNTVILNNSIKVDFNTTIIADDLYSVFARLLILSNKMTMNHTNAIAISVKCFSSVFKLLSIATAEYLNSISSYAKEDIDINMEINLVLGKFAAIADWEENSLSELGDYSLEELKVFIQGE